MSPAAFKPLKTIGETIVGYRQAHPQSSCEEILTYIKKNWPKSNTTIGSVACTLGKAAKKLKDPCLQPGRVVRAAELPTLTDINAVHEPEPTETEDEARERILLRYRAMERMTPRVIEGKMPSIIISGPPGVSKSWTTIRALEQSGRLRHDGMTNVGGGGPMRVPVRGDGTRVYPNPRRLDDDDIDECETHIDTPGYYDHISGTCTPVGLYHALWNMRNGGVLFLDDCDSVFRDEDALNILKVATDSTRERLVSWRKNAQWLDDLEIDKTFDFRGQIIFLTNIDFEEVIRRNHPSGEHFKALIDRAAYLCLTLRTARDFMIVLDWKAADSKEGFLWREPYGFNRRQVDELFGFLREYQNRFYNLSLRLVGQIAHMMKADPGNWKTDVLATKMRTI